eukprot:g7662.t1.1.5e17418a g7662  g7662.t1 contig24:1200036-1202445(+)
MALTEEFIRMKVNGDASSTTADTVSSNTDDSVNSNGEVSISGRASITNVEGTNVGDRGITGRGSTIDTRGKPPSDKLGYFALSNVQTLARSAGIGSLDGDGGLGSSSSSRSQFIDWQRRNLSQTRKEIATWNEGENGEQMMSWTSMSDEGRVSSRGGGSSRMGPLIAAMPSQRKRQMREGRKEQKQLQRSGNIGSGNTAALIGNNPNNKSKNSNNADKKDPTLIATALRTLEQDMSLLDNLASLQPQLSGTEVGLLLGAVLASGVGPIVFPGTSVTEVLAPAAAAFTASITIGSEYIGRVAVADGKEIAANTIQCAAEAEALLANAERVKAITPLCVGVGATCASGAILAPTIIEALNIGNSVQMVTELYLLCPLVSVLAAAVSNLALQETRGFATRAINVGVRRFAKSGNVGRTWLSSSEQVQKSSKSKTDRWWSFAASVLPAPVIGSIVGGPALSSKCILIAALAACQSAYFLALAEGVLARATDAVALKARSAAVCDTYANQGSRNSAILPFTSALSAFCAAATAAIVELPFFDTVSALYGTVGEVALVSTFPILSSAFAAAASVSKARCEVDAEAACQAASTLALEYDGKDDDDPVLRPFYAVAELINLAVSSGWRSVRIGLINPLNNVWRFSRRVILGFRWKRRWRGKGGRWLKGGEGMA